MCVAAFIAPQFAQRSRLRISEQKFIHHAPRERRRKIRAVADHPHSPKPSFAPAARAGTTGFMAANLWPIPILGRFGWTLFVWRRRDLRHLAVEVNFNRVTRPNRLALCFASNAESSSTSSSISTNEKIAGVVTGDFNVREKLKRIGHASEDHGYRLFIPHRSSDIMFTQTCFVTSADEALQHRRHFSDYWSASSFLCTKVTPIPGAPEVTVRKLYMGGDSAEISTHFQYFEMNLNPIPVLGAHSAFVAVYNQRHGGSDIVAVDKHDDCTELRVIELREGDPRECQGRTLIAKVASEEFYGTLSDSVLAAVHERLRNKLRDAGAALKSETDYRVLMDNSPKVAMHKRKNELLVELIG